MDSQAIIECFVTNDGLKKMLPEMELTRQRMFMLKEPERIFLEQYLVHGLSIREIAMITGTGRQVVARKIGRLIGILTGRKYIRIYVCRHTLADVISEISYDYLVRNLGYRVLAIKYQLPQYRVRKILKKINRIAENGTNDWQGKVL